MKKETMTKEQVELKLRLNEGSIFKFLNNLVKEYPNDADLGGAIRKMIINSK